MKNEVLLRISECKELTTYHYKIIIYLLSKREATQSVIAKDLETSKQSINRCCKDLISMDILIKKRAEGRNMFLALNPSPNFEIKGQQRLMYDRFVE